MPSSTAGSLSMHSAVVPASCPARRGCASRCGSSTAAALDRGTIDGKVRAAPDLRFQLDFAAEHAAMRSTIDRPRPRPRAMLAP